MSRRKGRVLHHHRPKRLLGSWTLQRAGGIGVVCGLLAVLMAGLFDTSGSLLWPYAALLAVTALCGASVLWITASDMRSRGTTARMRPIRGFDVAVGLVLLLPSLWALSEASPLLGL